MTILPYFDKFILRPRLRVDHQIKGPIKKIIVFARLPSPTFDYFLAGRIAAAGMPVAEVVDLASGDLPGPNPNGALVIFCRYANRASLDWVGTNANLLAGVGLFIDDDLAAWLTSSMAPAAYSIYLARNGILPLRRLNRYLDCIWTATPALKQSLGEQRAIVLPPAPRTSDFASAFCERARRVVRIVFLAEFHSPEHQFLLTIIPKVLERRPGVEIEVTETRRWASEWRKIPGVTISPFRPWPAFRAYTAANPADIALVPLLQNRINISRSGTKRIDVARMGAAGVYSQGSVFQTNAEAAEIFVPNEPQAWVDVIVNLIDDDTRRARASAATRIVVERQATAARSFPGLDEFLRR